MYGYHRQPLIHVPDWARLLSNHYWRIRNEGRDKAKRRKYYRYIAKEKLRLAEMGINQELIKTTCRYLSSFHVITGDKLLHLQTVQSPQLSFDFTYLD